MHSNYAIFTTTARYFRKDYENEAFVPSCPRGLFIYFRPVYHPTEHEPQPHKYLIIFAQHTPTYDLKSSRSAMSDKPQVRLPNAIPRKPVVPGPNSWAIEENKVNDEQKQPIHQNSRPHPEEKLMPATSRPSTSDEALPLPVTRDYTQPATPVEFPNSTMPTPKHRMVTDPTTPKVPFMSRNSSINKLRKKFSNQKLGEEEKAIADENAPPLPLIPGQTVQIKGIWQTEQVSHATPPASAPPSTHTPDPLCSLSEDQNARSGSPTRLHQSTPAPSQPLGQPTRRYLRENGLPNPPVLRSSLAGSSLNSDEAKSESQVQPGEGMILGHGSLAPTTSGSYGRVGEVEIVDSNGVSRAVSYMGVIEDGEGSATLVNTSYSPQLLDSAATLRPINGPLNGMYSPSNYSGVWENDPHVVCSLNIQYSTPLTSLLGVYAPTFQSYSPRIPSYAVLTKHVF